MSVAFMKEESAETAAETVLPDRPVSPHPNLVTKAGLARLEAELAAARAAFDASQSIEDINERRRKQALPLRDARYFEKRIRSAVVMPEPVDLSIVSFGTTVTIEREDGRVQRFAIVGEDEADPKAGTLSHAAPLALLLLGKAVGDVVTQNGQDIEITAIAGPLP